MSSPFFSIIVPVYNVKPYLIECIESVLCQSFRDYELILIDDGSTDGSALICDRYAIKDSRIVVIHKENGGLSEARNTGIDKACGYYLWFLDSDDFLLTTSAFDLVYQNITTSGSELCVFSYQKYWQNKKRLGNVFFTNIAPNTDISRGIEVTAYKAMACNKVVRRSLVSLHDMHFPKGKLGEDLGWCADLLYSSDRISFCDKSLMAYRQREGSITKTADYLFKKQHLADTLSLLDEAIKKYPKDFKRRLIFHYLSCEYVFLLANIYPYWDDFGPQVKEMEFLLNFTLSKKSYIASLLKKFLGLRVTSLLLSQYVKFKQLI